MSSKCCFCFYSVFSFITLMILIIALGKYDRSFSSTLDECQVTQVNYTRNIHDTENMIDCDCGKRCTSSEGTCVKVFLSLNDIQNKLAWKDLQDTHLGECTFPERQCRDVPRSQALINAKLKADGFLDYKSTNTTIPCYRYNDDLFLEDSFGMDLLIGVSVLFGVAFIGCLISSCAIYIDGRRKKQPSNPIV
jgi:hypothetical protein